MLSSSPVEAPTRSSPSVDRSDACLAGTTVPGSRSARKLATAAARVDRGAVASPVLFCQGHHVTTPPSSATRTIRDGGREDEVSTVMPGDPGWLLGCGRGDGYPDLLACAGWGRVGDALGELPASTSQRYFPPAGFAVEQVLFVAAVCAGAQAVEVGRGELGSSGPPVSAWFPSPPPPSLLRRLGFRRRHDH